jgi:hypothetical protein
LECRGNGDNGDQKDDHAGKGPNANAPCEFRENLWIVGQFWQVTVGEHGVDPKSETQNHKDNGNDGPIFLL